MGLTGGLRVSEASAFDMLETLTDSGGRARVTRARFGEMARQVSEGAAMTLRDDAGALVAVVGLWPEADHVEAWLAVGPAMRPNLRAARRRIGELLEAVAGSVSPVEVRLYVRRAERVAGARLATWWGFERVGAEQTPCGPVEVFSRRFGGAT